jgi:lysozyme
MTEKVLGIDVSRWQDNNSTAQQMDFVKSYAAGARFVFIKSSQANYADEDLLYNWKSAKAAGLLRAAYHFLTWDIDPKIQAQYAWSLIKSDPGELPPIVDFEWWSVIPSNAYDKLWNYVVEMEKLCGKKPIIYTGAFFWNAYGTQADVWKNYPLWIASYSDEAYMLDKVKDLTPWDNWLFWQFSSKGDGKKFGAESLDLDMNWFNGSLNDLYRFANISDPVPQPPPIEPPLPPITTDVRMMVVSDIVTIREKPSIFSKKLGSKTKGEEVFVHDFGGSSCWAQQPDGTWCAIEYINKRYLERID